MRQFEIIIILLLFINVSFTQSKWKRENYSNFNSNNFKTFDAFYDTINFSDIDYPLLNAAIFFVTNEIRLKFGRRELKYAEELEISAWNHSKKMVEQNFFAHKNPFDKDRKTPSDRGKLAGICNPYLAENISEYFGIQYTGKTSFYVLSKGKFSYDNITPIPNHTYLSFAEAVLGSWMNSPGHKRNILDTDALQLGCGAYFYKSQNDMPLFKSTQNFQCYEPIKKCDRIDKLP